ncbi:hypothetical protein HWV62_44265 [Athelia sp. TMB]|nr:hypothetical protein HWV62_44265 [Athelia sp. TMB]
MKYLFAERGERLKAEGYYDIYLALNREYLGVDWGVQPTRHAMIAISREHLMPDDSFNAIQHALADSSDHSVNTEQQHYAIKHGDTPRLSNLVVWRARWVIHQWWKVLALDGEPLCPLRQREVFQEENINTHVSRTVAAAIQSSLPNALAASLETAMPALLQSIAQIVSAANVVPLQTALPSSPLNYPSTPLPSSSIPPPDPVVASPAESLPVASPHPSEFPAPQLGAPPPQPLPASLKRSVSPESPSPSKHPRYQKAPKVPDNPTVFETTSSGFDAMLADFEDDDETKDEFELPTDADEDSYDDEDMYVDVPRLNDGSEHEAVEDPDDDVDEEGDSRMGLVTTEEIIGTSESLGTRCVSRMLSTLVPATPTPPSARRPPKPFAAAPPLLAVPPSFSIILETPSPSTIPPRPLVALCLTGNILICKWGVHKDVYLS